MKFLIIFLTVIIAFADANNVTEDAERALPNLDFAPTLRKYLKELNDPYDFEDRNILIDNKNYDIKLDAILSGSIKKLSDLDIKKFKANFIFKFEIDMNLPSEMHLDITNYNFEGWLGLIKIFGDGKLSLKIKNTVFKAHGSLGTKNVNDKKHIFLKTIEPKLTFDQFNFQITGYLNDDDRSEMLTNMINNIVAVTQNTEIMNDALAKIIMKLSEGLLIPLPI